MSESAAEAPAAGSPAEGGETGTSHELLQRLRQLEAENSALARANENQRETYERCLDEVANHVVQALLNQKDLREECIKLKKRVFDLERQNQALSDLFQQKLQLSAGSLPQLPSHPPPAPPDAPSSPQPGCAEQPPALLPLGRGAPPREAPAEGPPGSAGLGPGPGSGSPSLDALSPFFKKKAQILEALRKLEETDPRRGDPDSPASPEPPARPRCPLRGAESSPCSSPEEAGPPRGALLSALAERLLRGDGGCCRPGAETPGSPPSPCKALKASGPPGAPRLSPQLARASRIPCRGGQPEAASPVPSRRPSPEGPPPAAAEPPGTRRGPGGSAVARRPGKKPSEPGYLPFKERLAALGKLRGAEGREPPGRPGMGGSLKHPETAHGGGEPLARCYSSGSMGWRAEGDGGKAGKGRAGGGRTPPPRVPPAKAAAGSPTKAAAKAGGGGGKTGAPRADEPKPPAPKAPAGARKTPAGPEAAGAAGAAGHSAIEEKVMKGIEENVLRLQGQEKAPAGEVKPKAAGGLASWFGLRKSKLPALSRRAEAAKGRDWAGAPAPLRREVKLAARKLEAESLNISKLMEKAEDLRKALQEEQAFINGLALEKGRPRARGGPPERGPSQLQVMYQEVTAENFMQQLLNRVDGKDASYESRLEHKRDLCDLQRVSPDAKDARLFRPPRNGIVGHLRGCPEPPDKAPDLALRDELPSDESLSESGTSQHFPACGSLTRTLDSGIGTFPPPDYCSGAPAKSAPKPRGRPEAALGAGPARPAALTKVPRKARTLEREVPSVEELLVPGKHQSMPAFHGVLACAEPPAGLAGRRGGPQDAEAGKPRRVQQSKNWTFPNAKACSAADPFLCSAGAPEGLYRPTLAPAHGPAGRRGTSPEAPAALPPALSASSSRTPSASDVGDEGSTEARSRDAGQGPPGLEHSESLSDSLYDSLSSCGSQG
ncbi:nck-associated protein 5-like isoform X2 [Struthio camelus]